MLHVSAGHLLCSHVLAPLIAAHHTTNKCAGSAAGAPDGTFYGNGLLGQRVIVVPSQDLVIARMGLNFLNDFDPVRAPPPFWLAAHCLGMCVVVMMRSPPPRHASPCTSVAV